MIPVARRRRGHEHHAAVRRRASTSATLGGAVLTVLGLVFVMNVVNFSDGIDGLAAGVCAISAVAFAIIAFDLGRDGGRRAGGDHRRAPRSAS